MNKTKALYVQYSHYLLIECTYTIILKTTFIKISPYVRVKKLAHRFVTLENGGVLNRNYIYFANSSIVVVKPAFNQSPPLIIKYNYRKFK